MKTLVITGAGRRLGLYLAQEFHALGWQIFALTRNGQSAPLASLEGERCHLLEMGNYTEASVQQAIEQIQSMTDKIDLLIHNASIYEADKFHLNDMFGYYEQLFHVHMRLPALLNEGLFSLLSHVMEPGNIIHITDIYADNPNPDYALYCSTKAGLESLNKSFAKRFSPSVRVNSIQPGPIKFLDEHQQDHKDKVMQETLIPAEGGFHPILLAVQFLLDNSYVTGTAIKVDGGRALNRG